MKGIEVTRFAGDVSIAGLRRCSQVPSYPPGLTDHVLVDVGDQGLGKGMKASRASFDGR